MEDHSEANVRWTEGGSLSNGIVVVKKKNNGIVMQVAELKGKQWLFIITDNKKFPENLVEK